MCVYVCECVFVVAALIETVYLVFFSGDNADLQRKAVFPHLCNQLQSFIIKCSRSSNLTSRIKKVRNVSFRWLNLDPHAENKNFCSYEILRQTLRENYTNINTQIKPFSSIPVT